LHWFAAGPCDRRAPSFYPAIRSALPQAALAIVAHAIAVRIGGGWRHCGENTADRDQQGRKKNEVLHLFFPFSHPASGRDADD